MKTATYIITLAISLLALSCNTAVPDNTPYVISSAKMAQESATQGNVAFPTDALFGTYVIQSGDTDYRASNAKWSYNTTSSAWLPTDYPQGIGVNGIASVYAYAPYSDSTVIVNNKFPINLAADQSTNEIDFKNADIMWAEGVTTAESTNLNLLFKHKMVKMVFNLYAGNGFDKLPEAGNTPTTSDVNLYLKGLALKGQMNIIDGSVSDQQAPDGSKIYPRLMLDNNGQQGTGEKGNPKIFECIVLPQDIDNNEFSINLLIEGALHTNEISLDDITMTAGMEYNINLTIHELGLDIGIEHIIPWITLPPDTGIFVRYNYEVLVNLDAIAATTITSDTRVQQRIIYDGSTIMGDGTGVGGISHEYLFTDRTINRKIAAEAIVAYAMTPDKTAIDTLDGVILKVLRKFDPAITIADLGTTPGTIPTGDIHGGPVNNQIYSEGTKPSLPTIYYYYNTILFNVDGIPYLPYLATVKSDKETVPSLIPLP